MMGAGMLEYASEKVNDAIIAAGDWIGDMLIGAADKMMNKATELSVAGMNKTGNLLGSAAAGVGRVGESLSSGVSAPSKSPEISEPALARSQQTEISSPPTNSISSPEIDGMVASANLSNSIQTAEVSQSTLGDIAAPATNMAVQREQQSMTMNA